MGDSVYIDKLGIEVECAVGSVPADADIPNFKTTGDGSLRAPDHLKCKEFVSNPMRYPDELDDLEEDLQVLYRHIEEVNPSMGLHVHFSLNKEGWMHRLCSKKFTDFFWERLEESDLYDKNVRLRDRMSGRFYSGTNYAKKVDDPKTVDKMLHRDRERVRKYWAVNYKTLLRDTKTIEARIFPAMPTPDQVMEAVDLVTTTVNAYLMKKMYQEDISGELTVRPSADQQTRHDLSEDTVKVESKTYEL